MKKNKLLNKKNVEFSPSDKICDSLEGHEMKLRIDWLSIVSRFHSEEEKSEFVQKLQSLPEREWKSYVVQKKSPRNATGTCHPYKYGLCISRNEPDAPMLAYLMWGPKAPGTGGFSIQFHPQHMTGKRMDLLLKWLSDRLGETFAHLLARAWVTRLDIALDIYGCKLNDYLWGLKKSSIYKDYDNDKGLPGLSLGAFDSKLSVLIYGKINAAQFERIAFPERAGYVNEKGRCKREYFLEIDKEEHPQFLRVEMRIQPESTGPGKRGCRQKALMLSDVIKLDNPFERLFVYKRKLEGELINAVFTNDRPKTNGIKAWVDVLRRGDSGGRLARKFSNLLSLNEVELFDKHDVWSFWPVCMAKLGQVIGTLKPEFATEKEMAVSQFVEDTRKRKRKTRHQKRQEQEHSKP
ncbi:TPA: hypothetical protein ACQ72S_004416 [Escherichia coli]|uniref:hypothetical protein n=1 Tax=Escherichia coli TaxID=562 RepID=UPI000337669E|nr:hypothetical protein [Escherichia coli]EFE0693233.1 hypothetical protein [Escherichia coli]EFF9395611.1 hypothetical protein [Escherichia coli]EFK3692827.1 hypothetical protein [Escherichia coli]EFM3262150.1 hypothetical protein [Escherichia coli]EFN5615383.1 hypothetical protein [Escherichia coli]